MQGMASFGGPAPHSNGGREDARASLQAISSLFGVRYSLQQAAQC